MITYNLSKFIERKGVTQTEFERKCGLSQGHIIKTIKGNKALGSDKLEKILAAYPELDMNWLFGKENFPTQNVQSINDSNADTIVQTDGNHNNFFTPSEKSAMESVIEEKDKRIEGLEREVASLKANNDKLWELVMNNKQNH